MVDSFEIVFILKISMQLSGFCQIYVDLYLYIALNKLDFFSNSIFSQRYHNVIQMKIHSCSGWKSRDRFTVRLTTVYSGQILHSNTQTNVATNCHASLK